MMKPKYDTATIVIPTYNRRDLIDATLSTLARLRGARSHQVIVSDDGSSDDTERVVRGYERHLDLTYCYQEDRGFRAAKARNAALRLARHPVVIFLDTGMLVSSWFAEAHLAAHADSGEPTVVGGYTYGFDRNNESAQLLAQSIDWSDLDASIGRVRRDETLADPREEIFRLVEDDLERLVAPWSLMWSCNLSVELDVFRIVGGFNEAFTTWGGEDTDLAYRLYRCGARFALARNAEAIHAPHPKNGDVLQAGSVANFERETKKFHDPILALLGKYGDIGLNRHFLNWATSTEPSPSARPRSSVSTASLASPCRERD